MSLQNSLRVVEVNRIDDLAAHRTEWDRLLVQTPRANFFQTLDWLTVYWKYFGQQQRLRVLMMFDEDRLVGIIPLMLQDRKTRVGKIRVLGYPLDGWGTCYGPIGEPTEAILTAGLEHLSKSRRDWDLIELDWTADVTLPIVESTYRAIGWRPQTHETCQTSRINLSLTWEEYWRSRTSKFRNNVRRCEKRLAEMGSVLVVHHRTSDDSTGDPRWDLYKMCEQVAAGSWQGSSTDGNTITHERVCEFLREVHVTAARQGMVSMHLVLVDDQPAAFAYNYTFHGTVYGLRMGYDGRFATAGPGTTLLFHLVRHEFESGDQEIDMGEGDSRYKHSWRTESGLSFRVRHFPRASLRAQMIRLRGLFDKSLDLVRHK